MNTDKSQYRNFLVDIYGFVCDGNIDEAKSQLNFLIKEFDFKSLCEENIVEILIKFYEKIGDDKAITTKGKSYSGNEIVAEIKSNSDFGKDTIGMIIRLTVDLLKRDKLNVDEENMIYDAKAARLAMRFHNWCEKLTLTINRNCYVEYAPHSYQKKPTGALFAIYQKESKNESN